MRTLKGAGIFAVSIALSLVASVASAQDNGDFQVERFEPLPAQGTNILNVAKSQVLPHAGPAVGLFLHYMTDPIQAITRDADGNESDAEILSSSLKGELTAAFGLLDFFDLGLVLPVVLYQDGNLENAGLSGELDSFDLSDLRVIPKLQLINPDNSIGLGAALLGTFTLPMGSTFNTDGALRFEPRLAVDWTNGEGFVVATNIAYSFRDERVVGSHVSDDAVRWGVALEVPLIGDELQAIGSVYGDIPTENERDAEFQTLETEEDVDGATELTVGVQYWIGDIVTQAGGGLGTNAAVGSPDMRFFLSAGWTPLNRDADEDGIEDDQDRCPEVREDMDGFEDKDGCPEDDNDADNILDKDDECPDDPEDMDGFEDTNGCPDLDNDGDGVADDMDECPLEKGAEEFKGCPDTDGDLLIDRDDKCPEAAEDKDGFQDEDGCPEADNDGDGILDGDDKCPLEPETLNGIEDTDGCPDKGRIVVTKTKIEILDKIFFDNNKATIKEKSFTLLDQIGSVIKSSPKITKIRIEGHTDSKGRDKHNLKLSQSRADSVKAYLVKAGIEEGRLEAIGYGETKPIGDNKTKEGRDSNRRVEFAITEYDGKTTEGPVVLESSELVKDDGKDAPKKEEAKEAPKTDGAKEAPKTEEAPKTDAPKKDAKPAEEKK